jgi:hypothetical protein
MNSRSGLQVRWLEDLVQDLRFGLRFLIKQPGALVASIGALSLGIGLVIFGYCLIQGLFFRLLPFPEPERLAYTSIAGPAYRDWRTANRV